MKSLILFIVLSMGVFAYAQRPKIVVERHPGQSDSAMHSDSVMPRRVVIDPGELMYRMRVDSLNQVTEYKIRSYIEKLERKFTDPAVEEEVGRLIGEAVMEQQMALVDLQVERAINLRDTLLMEGLKLALRELVKQNLITTEGFEQRLRRLEGAFEPPR